MCLGLSARIGVVLLAASTSAIAADSLPKGEAIYRSRCAACHGRQGEGTKKHSRPLEGSRSVSQLAELIAETMPEDDPGSLSMDEATAVAGYVYETFYSRIARERNRPARIELARLTARQYRLAVADLVGSFHGPAAWGDVRGLRGEYFSGSGFSQKREDEGQESQAGLAALDRRIDFDFGTGAPFEEITEPSTFSIRWRGSLLAPETGEYELIVRTDHAAKLFVNDANGALIDAWVKSGSENEHRASLFLVSGHVYPLRLEFSKARQGVDDSDKQQQPPPSAPASIALFWKRPQAAAAEIIPARQLSPGEARDVFVCATPFPPDDRSYGWERGTSVSKAWDEATTAAALEAAGYVAAHLDELADTSEDAAHRAGKLHTFCHTFVERAFRRPLNVEQIQVVDKRLAAAGESAEAAVKRVVLLALKSPRFLYRELSEGRQQSTDADLYDVASRLSFGLWNSIPDRELLAAAAEGRLANDQEVARQAERMLADLRGRAKLQEFLLTWLRADLVGDLAKNPQAFPDFDAAAVADLRTSLALFLEEITWSDESDFRELLQSDVLFLNSRLAQLYGTGAVTGDEWAAVTPEGQQRAGVLTHPYLLANFAHENESSPIHRGVFLARGVLGQALRPPPEAVAPLAAELHPGMTTRERVSLQTRSAACMTCHAIINPLGFTLEHFDAIGRYREQDRGRPIDARGAYQTQSGLQIEIDGSRELARYLAGSEEVQAAFVEQLFHHLVQQPVAAFGPKTLDELRRKFESNQFHIRRLAVDVMVASARCNRQTDGQ